VRQPSLRSIGVDSLQSVTHSCAVAELLLVILPEFVREVSEAFYAIDHRDLYNVMLDVTMVVMHRCHLSYEQVDALDEMVAPLKHALGFPAGRRLLASSK
jgi:hypothetical protein